jgi:osmotically-inducible protein OsmY
MSRKHALAFLIALAPLLGGCAAAVVGGAALAGGAAHDRRDTSTYFDDKRIDLAVHDAINKDKELTLRNNVTIIVYNGVILLIGEVRTPELKARAEKIVSGYEGTKKVVNELEVTEPQDFWARRADGGITGRVKTALLDITSIEGFDPLRVNVTTAHRVVYLMGMVTQQEADAAVEVARDVDGVEKVVKVFEYTD